MSIFWNRIIPAIFRSFPCCLVKKTLVAMGGFASPRMLVILQDLLYYLRIGNKTRNWKISSWKKARTQVWEEMAQRLRARADDPILYLEFGVAEGDSIRWWSQHLAGMNALLHGFDTFSGMPTGEGKWQRGQFSTDGNLPIIPDNRVSFFKGRFDATLPAYKLDTSRRLVINMDADSYSATLYVLRALRSGLKAGTLIYFDELSQVDQEWAALDDFQQETGIKFEPISFDMSRTFVAFEIK